jgi:hypothetical protein
MASFLEEEVPPVNPLSVSVIEEVGRCFLEQLAPGTLLHPMPLDVLDLVDNILPNFGVHCYPATPAEIGNRAGATDPRGDSEIIILVSESVWDALESDAPRSHYARTTVCHEIGHAILHVPLLRRRLLATDVLARTQRSNLRPYLDPEWQAWAFAGAILMPSATLRMLQVRHGGLPASLVASTYHVSEQMAQSHLRKLKWVQGG